MACNLILKQEDIKISSCPAAHTCLSIWEMLRQDAGWVDWGKGTSQLKLKTLSAAVAADEQSHPGCGQHREAHCAFLLCFSRAAPSFSSARSLPSPSPPPRSSLLYGLQHVWLSHMLVLALLHQCVGCGVRVFHSCSPLGNTTFWGRAEKPPS